MRFVLGRSIISQRGKFVVFEGIDGAGKSTVLEAVAANLTAAGQRLVTWRDPGDTAIGQELRCLLLEKRATALAPLTELLLFCASRAQLVAEKIAPALARGELVLCDRFFYSTLAYQAGVLPADTLEQVARLSAGGLEPDLVVLCDLPATVALERLPAAADRIESRGAAFLETARQNFLRLLQPLTPARAVILDARQTPAQLRAQALEAVNGLF